MPLCMETTALHTICRQTARYIVNKASETDIHRKNDKLHEKFVMFKSCLICYVSHAAFLYLFFSVSKKKNIRPENAEKYYSRITFSSAIENLQ